MPTNIPDVTTIEKMHFQQLQNNQQVPSMNHVPENKVTNVSPQSSTINNNPLPSMQCSNNVTNHLQQSNSTTFNVVDGNLTLNNNCIKTMTIDDQQNYFSEHVNEPLMNNNVNQCQVNMINDNNNKKLSNNVNNNNCTNDKSLLNVCDNDRTRPAVVILSGDNGKDVTGITFGFDINEQLLLGDVCSDFISRYIVPETIYSKSYEHERMIHFIGNGKKETEKRNPPFF